MSRPTFFPSAVTFRAWLEAHHATAPELWVGFYRKDAGRGGITYPEAVDQALCFGWIDGIKRKVDEVSYTNRFTPRRRGSSWSAANIRNVERLIAEGRMTAAGLTAFEARDRSDTPYSYANRPQRLAPSLERQFRARQRAWAFFAAQPPGYRRTAVFWVMSARRAVTRQRRLETLIGRSGRGERLPALSGTARVTKPARRKRR